MNVNFLPHFSRPQSSDSEFNKCIGLIPSFSKHDIYKYFTLSERVAITLR